MLLVLLVLISIVKVGDYHNAMMIHSCVYQIKTN